MNQSKLISYLSCFISIVIFIVLWWFKIGFNSIELNSQWYFPIIIFSLMTGFSFINNDIQTTPSKISKILYNLNNRIEDNLEKSVI